MEKRIKPGRLRAPAAFQRPGWPAGLGQPAESGPCRLPSGARACAAARPSRGLTVGASSRQHWFDASADTSSARVCITRARAQCARQPRGSPESPDASSNGRARVILAQRVAPEPCAQLQQTCANAARRFGQIDGETSARRMIGDGSSHAPTARSERGAASERTSSRTRRRAHGLLTRTMPPAVPRSH